MTKRYALTKFQPRYETQDTLTLYVADTPGDLEEIILSIWEENNYSLFLSDTKDKITLVRNNITLYKDQVIVNKLEKENINNIRAICSMDSYTTILSDITDNLITWNWSTTV